MMMNQCSIRRIVALLCLARVSEAIDGEADPIYRDCLHKCEESECFSSAAANQGQMLLQWKQFRCQSDCQYDCRDTRERARRKQGHPPNKYNGKWHFKRGYLFQEPAPLVSCTMNLALHITVWLSFRSLLHRQFPLSQQKQPNSEYAILWNTYWLLTANFWFWKAVSHYRDAPIIERIKVSSTVTVISYLLIMTILRSFRAKEEAVRIMIATPLIAFSITHILYLNTYKLDHEWDKKVCKTMAVAEFLTWAIWGLLICHPSRWNLWIAVAGSSLSMFLQTQDFPPYEDIIDGNSLGYATTIPVTYFWSRFIQEEAKLLALSQVKKTK